ncbi:thioredoxin fold domain-containing protein [Pseudomonas luteola]
MKKYLALSILTLSLCGCITDSEVKSKVKEAFAFTHPKVSLEFSILKSGMVLVKSDSELYLYDMDANIIVPAPKAVMLDKRMFLEDAVAKGDIRLKAIFDNKNLPDIRKLAKTNVVEQISNVPSVSVEANELSITRPSIPVAEWNRKEASSPTANQPHIKDDLDHSAENPVKADPIAHDVATATEEAKAKAQKSLDELKEQLRQKLGDTLNQHSSLPKTTQQAPLMQSRAPIVPSNLEVPKAPLIQRQFSYFNGTAVLKLGYSKEGRTLTAQEKKERIKNFAAKIPMAYTINYPAIGTEKLQLFVFTDYTCPFCHKLHNDLQLLNQAGITVRYLFYPRSYSAGPETPAAKLNMEQMRRAWCAPDQGEAFTELFETRQLEDYKCDQVSEAKGRIDFPGIYHHFMGSLFDLDETPTYFTNDGQLNSGYSNFNDFVKNKIQIEKGL